MDSVPRLYPSYSQVCTIPMKKTHISAEQTAFLLYFISATLACRISVPRPEIEPVPPTLNVRRLNHWTTREVPKNRWF